MRLSALLLLAVSLLPASTLLAQEKAEPERGPDRGTQMRVHGIQVLPAAGRPFTARDHIVWTRNLEDGTVTTTELYALVARDGQGRIYREHRSFVPLNSKRESRQFDLLILDPVSHSRTTCIIAARRCAVQSYHARTTFSLNPDGLFDNGMRFLSRVNLGHDEIDGVEVNGTRETLQIAAGAVGNSQTLVGTRDFWYSPELQVNLQVTRKDPRIGTQLLKLVELSMADPDPKIFQVPSGFVVERLVPETAAPSN
jgi:hypothetical protein